jgi:type I restriction enzyme S subunit
MNSQPSEWKKIIAAEGFAQISTTGKKVKTKDCAPIGKYPVVDQGQEMIGGYVDDSEKLISTNEPLIVFGDHTRAVKWVDFSFVPGADGTKILQAEPYLLPRFAYHQLRSLEIPNKGYSRHFKFLKELEFSVPPLPEQKVIADKLDILLAQVENTKARLERIPQILKRFRQSVLAAAVSGRLTEEWRKEVNLPDWSDVRLDKICYSISDGDHQAPPRAQNGIPFLVISNVTGGGIDFDSVSRWVPEDYYNSLKSIRKPSRNDLLYTVTGSFGIPVVVNTEQSFCFQRHIAIIKPNHNVVSTRYLAFYLQSPKAFAHAGSVATGTAQKTVSLTNLRKFPINLPTMDEQTEIVRRVDQLFAHANRIEQQVNNALARVNNLTQSILAKAFRGELTAQWRRDNPELISGENSASALLDRIKAERATKPAKKTRTGKKI